MTAKKRQLVTIKGTKDGLVFHLNDECNFEMLLRELKHTLQETHQKFLTGPIVHVYVKLGKRSANEAQKDRIRDIIRQKGNLLIQSIESDVQPEEQEQPQKLQPVKGIVRSGQTLEHSGDLLFLGDVNPGGTIVCSGSIYILGALRGIAHAGSGGDESAVIAASLMKPMQLRIAGIVSRPPDEWVTGDGQMEFAYIKDGIMELDKMNHLHQLVP